MFVRRSLTSVLFALLAVALTADIASACPNCKASVQTPATDGSGTSTPQSADVAAGFNKSIYVMLSGFVGVLGFVGYTLYRGARGHPLEATARQS